MQMAKGIYHLPAIDFLLNLIFNKEANAIQWNKGSLFNKWCWNNQRATLKKKNPDINLH